MKTEEVTGHSLHEQLREVYCSLKIIRVPKWRKVIWAESVTYMGVGKNSHGVLLLKPECRRRLEIGGGWW